VNIIEFNLVIKKNQIQFISRKYDIIQLLSPNS